MEPTHANLTQGHPIILIGLMGCGKTTVGRELSKSTGLPLLDMDAVIEEQIGKSIPDIFREEGESYFRAMETALLRYLAGKEGEHSRCSIISTGGGVVVREENRVLLRQLGFCVWLDVEIDILLQRTARANNRPLLQDTDRRARLEELMESRRPLYQETAHMVIDSSHMDVPSVVTAIHRATLQYYHPC